MSRGSRLGGWDILIQAVVTAAVGVFSLSYFFGYFPEDQILAVVIGGSVALYGWRRHRLRRHLGPGPESETIEELRERVACLEARGPVTGETDLVAQRLLELEERVDFAERLLTQDRSLSEAVAMTPTPNPAA